MIWCHESRLSAHVEYLGEVEAFGQMHDGGLALSVVAGICGRFPASPGTAKG